MELFLLSSRASNGKTVSAQGAADGAAEGAAAGAADGAAEIGVVRSWPVTKGSIWLKAMPNAGVLAA